MFLVSEILSLWTKLTQEAIASHIPDQPICLIRRNACKSSEYHKLTNLHLEGDRKCYEIAPLFCVACPKEAEVELSLVK